MGRMIGVRTGGEKKKRSRSSHSSRTKPRDIAVGLTALLALFCSCNSYSWNYDEHKELGVKAYVNACGSLTSNKKAGESFTISMRQAALCLNIQEQAEQYGIRSALSGDHIKVPEDFLDIEAERQSLSWLDYGSLALANHDHFWPNVKKTWRHYHELAIESAKKAHDYWLSASQAKAISELEKALTYSSFADHFLQDSFAIGHGGFSRINSFQNPSLIFHDNWNRTGRLMMGHKYELTASTDNVNEAMKDVALLPPKTCEKNLNEDCSIDIWEAYGDDYLDLDKNSENYRRIIDTNKYSVLAVMLTFIDGKDYGYSMAADRHFPISTQYFHQTSVYWSSEKHGYEIVKNNECPEKSGYVSHGDCWFNLENAYMEPVYPDVTLGINATTFGGGEGGRLFSGGTVIYSPYSPKYFSSWPKVLRIYSKLVSDQFSLGGQTYGESGLNIVLPNLYTDTPISHEIDVAIAKARRFVTYPDTQTVRGYYLGINSNLDILKYKLSLGVGWFIPNSNYHSMFKLQLTAGWDFGVLGGGPISRWSN